MGLEEDSSFRSIIGPLLKFIVGKGDAIISGMII